MAKVRAKSGSVGDAGLRLPAELRIGGASALKEQLLLALAADAPLRLDAAAVSATDTSGLQLLLAAVRGARARGHAVHWHAVSEVLARDARQLGIAQELELP